MAIRKYQESGNTLYEVYVHVKSSVDPLIRIQRRRRNFKTYKEALKEETRITRKALKEIGTREEQGNTWQRIVELWYFDQYHNGGDRYTNKFTIEDYRRMLEKYTKSWMKRPPSGLTRGDGKIVLNNALKMGKSKSFVTKIKNTINPQFAP